MSSNNQTLQTLYVALLFAFIFLIWGSGLSWLWMLGVIALGSLGLVVLRKRLSRLQLVATASIFFIGIMGYCWYISASRH